MNARKFSRGTRRPRGRAGIRPRTVRPERTGCLMAFATLAELGIMGGLAYGIAILLGLLR